jgi:hypothetical protein
MLVESFQYTIEEILELRERINPKPQYQRTPVWKIDRKRLLVDSIFKGYDLPKFYLNKISGNTFFDFEVCDGQQRLRSIWEFCDDQYSIGKHTSFNGTSLEGKKFSALSPDAKVFFLSFKLTIAQIIEANQNEIRDLFARLQKGMGLNQAELRRALSTSIGLYVESVVDNHNFFKSCGFPNLRNKHQDYLDHVIAYMVNDFKYDFKGQILRDVYMNMTPTRAMQLIKDASHVLDEMEKINSFSLGIFRNKWAFVDTFIIIYQNRIEGKKVLHKEFVKTFGEFEKLRKAFNKSPKFLIEKAMPTDEERFLYDYIVSFSKDGNLKANMKRRNDAFLFKFKNQFK